MKEDWWRWAVCVAAVGVFISAFTAAGFPVWIVLVAAVSAIGLAALAIWLTCR
jgi:hypothetical protein